MQDALILEINCRRVFVLESFKQMWQSTSNQIVCTVLQAKTTATGLEVEAVLKSTGKTVKFSIFNMPIIIVWA